jgi:flagellar motor switch protein FliN/FliY
MAPEFALKIFQLVSSEEATEVDDMVLSVVSEFIATHISAEIQEVESKGNASGLGYATPETLNESKAMIMFPQGDFVLSSYPLTYDGNAYTLWECIGGDAAEGLTKALGGGGADDSAGLTPIDLGGMNAAAGGAPRGGAAMGAAPMGGMQQPMGGAMPNMGMGMQQPMGGMQNMAMGGGMPMGGMGMGMGMPQNMGVNMGMNVPNVQQLQYPNLQAGLNAGEQGNISLIMDVFMEMTVELGRTKKTIKDILGMGEGTIIELDKLAGEPVDILVNHKKIAKGEVVVIDENFGVRVTEILSPMERVTDIN